MLSVLKPSELSWIRDLAIARARPARPDAPGGDPQRTSPVLTERIEALIASLPHDAQAELLALVRLGRGDGDWSALLADARRQDGAMPRTIAGIQSLDEHIDRGLLALRRDDD